MEERIPAMAVVVRVALVRGLWELAAAMEMAQRSVVGEVEVVLRTMVVAMVRVAPPRPVKMAAMAVTAVQEIYRTAIMPGRQGRVGLALTMAMAAMVVSGGMLWMEGPEAKGGMVAHLVQMAAMAAMVAMVAMGMMIAMADVVAMGAMVISKGAMGVMGGMQEAGVAENMVVMVAMVGLAAMVMVAMADEAAIALDQMATAETGGAVAMDLTVVLAVTVVPVKVQATVEATVEMAAMVVPGQPVCISTRLQI